MQRNRQQSWLADILIGEEVSPMGIGHVIGIGALTAPAIAAFMAYINAH